MTIKKVELSPVVKNNFDNKIVGYDSVAPRTLSANKINWRTHSKHQQDILEGILNEVGWIQDVIVNKRTSKEWGTQRGRATLIDGHLRVRLALKRKIKKIPVKYVDLNPQQERLALATFDPISSLADTDKKMLEGVLDGITPNDRAISDFLVTLSEKESVQYAGRAEFDGVVLDGHDSDYVDVPDTVWPSDNEFGIPTLDINLCARGVDLPFLAWGSISRKTKNHGTWHFYVDDYRFNRIYERPDDVLLSNCRAIVEPNFSCFDQMPRVVVLWNTYKKRWFSRLCQSYGIRILVDLNVSVNFYNENFLGVPKGWRSYATRGYTERISATEKEYQLACEHAGTSSIYFLVYGGGKSVKEMCAKNNWVWFDEQQKLKKGNDNG